MGKDKPAIAGARDVESDLGIVFPDRRWSC